MGAVLHFDLRRLDGRVGLEQGAGQSRVPAPVVFGVGRRVHADVAAAGRHVSLEGGLLGGVEDVACGGEEDDGLVSGEVRRSEGGGVLGRGDGEVVGRAQLAQGGDAFVDGGVAETDGSGEDQHVVRGVSRCRLRGGG